VHAPELELDPELCWLACCAVFPAAPASEEEEADVEVVVVASPCENLSPKLRTTTPSLPSFVSPAVHVAPSWHCPS